MQHFGGNRIFFQNIDCSHFCSQRHIVPYDHKIIQNFKRESKNTTYKVLCPFWGKMPHFEYHQRWIFVPDDSQNRGSYPRMGSKPSILCYDSNPCLFRKCWSPRLWALKKMFPLWLENNNGCLSEILWKTEWLRIVSWKQFELIVLNL